MPRLQIGPKMDLKPSIMATAYHVPSLVTDFCATARVLVESSNGNLLPAKCILDSESANSYVSRDSATRLGIQIFPKFDKTQERCPECDLRPAYCVTRFKITSYFNLDDKINVNATVLKEIPANIPIRKVDPQFRSQLAEVALADPDFGAEAEIDIVLGSDVFWEILLPETKPARQGAPMMWMTRLGWIPAGNLEGRLAVMNHSVL